MSARAPRCAACGFLRGSHSSGARCPGHRLGWWTEPELVAAGWAVRVPGRVVAEGLERRAAFAAGMEERRARSGGRLEAGGSWRQVEVVGPDGVFVAIPHGWRRR